MIKVYCLYQHITADTDEVFYVGIGSLRRPYTKKNRNNKWHEVVKKHGYRVDVLKIFTNREQLLEWEKFLISFYGRLSENAGPLVNMNIGTEAVVKSKPRGPRGWHTKGVKLSEERRREMSIRMMGNKRRKPLQVYCTATGRKWNSRKEAAVDLGLNDSTLKNWLSKPKSARTTLRYLR